MAQRIAQVDPELAQLNKRLVHRQMEAMGLRAGLRAGTDLHALGWHTQASRAYMAQLRQGVTAALTARDAAFGDYRTGEAPKS
jgi:enoyl-CoA hydratase